MSQEEARILERERFFKNSWWGKTLCQQCGGLGYVVDDRNFWMVCLYCHGTGKLGTGLCR